MATKESIGKKALSSGAKAGIALVALLGLGGVVYAASRPRVVATTTTTTTTAIQPSGQVSGQTVSNLPPNEINIGEAAGQPTYTLSPGQSVEFDWTLINPNSIAVNFQFILPTYTASNGPVISYSGLNLTIPANSDATFPLTISLPSNAPVGQTWTGVLQAVTDNGAGVAKILTVTSVAPSVSS